MERIRTFFLVASMLAAGGGASTSALGAQPPTGNDIAPQNLADAFVSYAVQGVWATTLFAGDPADPETPLVQGLMHIRRDGTAQWDTTTATGQHPGFPTRGPTVYGTWSRVEGDTVRIVLFGYLDVLEEGEAAGMALARITFELGADNQVMEGVIASDLLPCPRGPLECPNPVDTGPLDLATTEQDIVPAVFERVPRP